MLRDISLSAARQKLPALVRELAEDSGLTFRIHLRNRVVAELRAPEPEPGRLVGIAALLKLSDDLARRPRPQSQRPAVTSQNYKEFLYGRWPPAGSRRGR